MEKQKDEMWKMKGDENYASLGMVTGDNS